MNLYQIEQEFMALSELLEADIAGLTMDEAAAHNEAITAAFAEINTQLENKIDGYIRVMQNFGLTADAIGEEIDRLRQRKARAEKSVERLKANIMGYLESTGSTKVQGALGGFRRQKSPASVEITAPDAIPAEYKRQEITEKIDKNMIAERLKIGDTIPGAELRENYHLRFIK